MFRLCLNDRFVWTSCGWSEEDCGFGWTSCGWSEEDCGFVCPSGKRWKSVWFEEGGVERVFG